MCIVLICIFSNVVIGLNFFFKVFIWKLLILVDKVERVKFYGVCIDIVWFKLGINEI